MIQLSHWEKDSFYSNIQVLIIGKGLVGTCAAIFLKMLRPEWRIVILDALPTPMAGASTRNAGFACFGSPTEMMADLEHMGPDKTWELVRLRWNGLQLLRSLIGDSGLAYKTSGGYEVFSDKDTFEKAASQLASLNASIHRITGEKKALQIADQFLEKRNIHTFYQVIHNKLEGQLHPGKMMKTLWNRAHQAGIPILSGLKVSTWETQGTGLVLETEFGGSLCTKQLIVCTNGFTNDWFEDARVVPARNQVLLTSPIENLPWKGCFHMNEGYVYFRDVGQRLLVGGGRHLDESGETTTAFGHSPAIQTYLQELIHQKLLPGHSFQITDQWSGILGVGQEKWPILERKSDRIVVAYRLGGMGVAIGSWLGRQAAKLLLDEKTKWYEA